MDAPAARFRIACAALAPATDPRVLALGEATTVETPD
jgi:hypothetical protein